MNKKQKLVLTAGFAIIASSIVTWILYGCRIFTKTQVLIEKKDELFPDIVQREWVDKFIWGLDLSGIISAVTVIICALLFFLNRTKNNQSQVAK